LRLTDSTDLGYAEQAKYLSSKWKNRCLWIENRFEPNP